MDVIARPRSVPVATSMMKTGARRVLIEARKPELFASVSAHHAVR
jgi:hypothetical protein